MEPNRENIEDLMRRYGYEEEEEAEIAYHLREARNRIFELERADAEAGGFGKLYTEVSLLRSMIPHLDALATCSPKGLSLGTTPKSGALGPLTRRSRPSRLPIHPSAL